MADISIVTPPPVVVTPTPTQRTTVNVQSVQEVALAVAGTGSASLAVAAPASLHIEVNSTSVPGPAGTAGPAGPAGGAPTFSGTAAYPLSGHSAVTLDSAGNMIYADAATIGHANRAIGIITGAFAAGAPATAQVGGTITEPTWAWTLDSPVWLGLAGALTQTVPSGALFYRRIAEPVTAQAVVLTVAQPIIK